MLKNLDEFEVVGVLYDSLKLIAVTESNNEHECLAYFMHGIKDDLLKTEYFQTYSPSLATTYVIHY